MTRKQRAEGRRQARAIVEIVRRAEDYEITASTCEALLIELAGICPANAREATMGLFALRTAREDAAAIDAMP